MAKTKPAKTSKAKEARKEAKKHLRPQKYDLDALEAAAEAQSIDRLLERATNLLYEVGDAEQALEVVATAVSQFPLSLPAWNLNAEINMEMNNSEAAYDSYLKAVDLDPLGDSNEEGGGPDKFLWLAQINPDGGSTSLSWYEKGISSLRMWRGRHLLNTTRDIDKKLCAALCGCAELYMTDLW